MREEEEKMQQRRRLFKVLSSVSLLRLLLLCATVTISLAAILSCCMFPSGKVAVRHASLTENDIAIERQRYELHWTRLSSPRQLLKEATPLQKLGRINDTVILNKLWKPPSVRKFVQCVQPSKSYTAPNGSKGYLLVNTNGGLNQMRAGISDMVAVARIINATLVVPKLDKNSFWRDSSIFSDVFDEEHFISSLVKDVKVVKKLPKEMLTAPKKYQTFRSWSGINYYAKVISHLWDDYQVIQAIKSDSRLANNDLPQDIQKLRCRVFYEALRFSPKIEAMGKLLVERMRSYGRYIALHLRYEKDMLAFSGCTYGLSSAEADELTTLRKNTPHWRVKDIDPVEQRAKGYCPLTPKEVGMFLRALGHPSDTPIYVAAGEIYGGDSRMADLRSAFPILMGKENLASPEELKPFVHHASQMAALDYIVSVESDVFVPTYSGNMARAVEGHRRFLGHRKTISPYRKGLVNLFDKIDQGSPNSTRKLSEKIMEMHRKRRGSPRKRKGPVSGTRGRKRFLSEEPFYQNPLPDCLCLKETLHMPMQETAEHKLGSS
ncbi:O-fucosyltransferase 7-like [Nymphaea colorata]|nr:O-fucosyltransferase 7-like [Nymphaea colorata]